MTIIGIISIVLFGIPCSMLLYLTLKNIKERND